MARTCAGVTRRDEPQLRSPGPPPAGPWGRCCRRRRVRTCHHRDRHVLHELDQLLRVALLVQSGSPSLVEFRAYPTSRRASLRSWHSTSRPRRYARFMGRYSLPLAGEVPGPARPAARSPGARRRLRHRHRDGRARRRGSAWRRCRRSIRHRRSSAPYGCGCRTSTCATGTPRRCRSTTTRSTWPLGAAGRSTSWPTRRVEWPRWRAWSARVARSPPSSGTARRQAARRRSSGGPRTRFDPDALAGSELPGCRRTPSLTPIVRSAAGLRPASHRDPRRTAGSTASRSGREPYLLERRPGRDFVQRCDRRGPGRLAASVPRPARRRPVRRAREGLGHRVPLAEPRLASRRIGSRS